MVVILVQQYHVGEKPAVILYTYINRHPGTPSKTKTKARMSLLDYSSIYFDEINLQVINVKDLKNYNMPLETDNHL